MAPTMKRPATSRMAIRPAKESAAQRAQREKADLLERRCFEIAEAVKNTAGLPEAVTTMLGNAKLIKECFAAPLEERHPFQAQAAMMLKDALALAEKGIEERIAAAERKVSEAETERAGKVAGEQLCQGTVDEKKEALDVAKVAFTEANEAVRAATQAVNEATRVQNIGDEELSEATGKKERLETLKATYESLKAGTVATEEVESKAKEVAEMARSLGFEEALLDTLPNALSQAPDNRDDLDGMMLKRVDDAFEERLAPLAAVIATGEPGKAARAAAVEQAQSALTSAEGAAERKKAARTDAQDALKSAQAALRTAAQTLKSHGPEAKKQLDVVEKAKAGLEEFRTGPLAALTALTNFTRKVAESDIGADGAAAPVAGA